MRHAINYSSSLAACERGDDHAPVRRTLIARRDAISSHDAVFQATSAQTQILTKSRLLHSQIVPDASVGFKESEHEEIALITFQCLMRSAVAVVQ